MVAAERAWRFDAEVQERSAARVARFEHGAAVFSDDLPRVYDANFVRIDDGVERLSAGDVEGLAESLQGQLAHRKLLLPGSPAAAALADELRRAGWSVTATVVMEYAGPPARDPAAAARAEQVDSRAVRGARYEALDERGEDVKRQVADYTERLSSAGAGRTFAAFAGGEVAAFCVLLEGGGTGEIDEVTTVPRFRGQRLGTAVVEAALAASLAGRNELTFVVAAAADWPREWYRRMGFREVGERWEVWKA